jgi:hypothetical protein
MIAPSAKARFSSLELVSFIHQIGDNPFLSHFCEDGARRNRNNDIISILTCFPAAGAVSSVGSTIGFFILYVLKCVKLTVHPENNIASFTSVTSIRTSFRNKLLPPEADTAVATIASRDLDFCIINKHFTGIYFT